MRLTRKIGLLVTVPLAAMMSFAALAISVALTDGQRAQRLQTLVSLAHRSADLARALQVERAAAVSLLVGPGPAMTQRTQTYLSAVTATDAAVAGYRALRAAGGVPAAAVPALDQISAQLDLLAALRGQVQSGTAAASAVAFQYRIIIASTVDYRETVAQAGQAPAEVADRIRASVQLSRAAEALGLQQVAVLRALDLGPLTPAGAAEITATRTAFTDATVSFTTAAPPQWRSWWQRATTGDQVLAAQQMQDRIARTAGGEVLRVDAGAWVAALGHRIDLVHEVEALADGAVASAVSDLRGSAIRRAVLASAAVLGAALVAVVLAVRLGRPVVRDLGRLRDSARAVAYEQLPQLVAQLNEPRSSQTLSPADIVADAPSAARDVGRHEIGEVAGAFDDVYRAAVRAAAELAEARVGVARMYVALARRLQRRVSQMTAQLDTAERDERDEARLRWLFGLDHLVTLTRRTTDSLLVLGGHGPATVRAEAVALHDVLRAAASRIEAYQRVYVHTLDYDLGVAGHTAEELVLLLAELMDNAATLSQEPVVVHARRLVDRVIVQIIDTGLGIEARRRRQLNERLAAPSVDVDSVSHMGLTVVGLLATHYGLMVELRANTPHGTIAEVTVPAALLRTPPPPPVMSGDDTGGGGRHRPQVLAMTAAAMPRPRPLLDAFLSAPSGGAAVGETTAELPIFASLRPATWPGGITGDGMAGGTRPAVAEWSWQAAGPPVQYATVNGLPVRPRSQLVPRVVGVDPVDEPAPQRDPHQVAAAMLAYARGVSQSHTRHASCSFSAGDLRKR